MTFNDDEKLQSSIQIQNYDDFQSTCEDQQLKKVSLQESIRKKKDKDDSKCKQNSNTYQSFFINDLIKMVQISLIVCLLIFIGIMSYAIVNQVRQFWFQTQARAVTINDNLQRNGPIIKMELTSNDIIQNEDNLKNSKQATVSTSIDEEQTDQEQKQLEIALEQNILENIEEVVVQTDEFKQSDEKIIDDPQSVELKQQRPDQKKQISLSSLTAKELITGNENINKDSQLTSKITQSQSNQNSPLNDRNDPQPSSKSTESSQSTVYTVTPDEEKIIYDPVLIQINKLKKKAGGNFKETIYTMRNTQITQKQYKMAKQLIQITQFYNPKQKKFDVEHSFISKQQYSQQQCITKQQQINILVENEKAYYSQKYKQPWTQIQSQLPFCIIVPSYKNNHEHNIFKNLNSIFQQQYQNYHIIYIDDHSMDGTPEKVNEYMTTYNIAQEKLSLYVNQENKKALSNIYKAAHSYCQEKEIMIIVDGDDYLIGTQVLKLLNFQYQTKKLLAAYTNYLRINEPYYVKVGTSTPYPKTIANKRAFRKNYTIFRASHLRSYYVDLFRKIKVQDLQDQNHNFFTAANDFAIMMPILEMTAPHVQYIPELTYLYDSGTGLNNFQSKQGVQAANAKIIARRKVYSPVNINKFYEIKRNHKE